MGATKRAIQQIINNRDKKLKGGYNSIPFGMPRLEAHIPGLQKPNYVILTANSGIGKTKVAKNLFVFKPFDFVRKNPAAGIKYTCLYFLLEEPDENWIQSAICYKLRTEFKQRISIKELRSQLKPHDPTAVIDPVTLSRVAALEPYLDEMEKSVHLIRGIDKPYAIYKHCVEFLEDSVVGDWMLGPKKIWHPAKKTMVTELAKDYYKFNHPDHYVEIIIDHAALLTPEKGQDLWEAIRILSSRYLVNLRNIYGCSIVLLQQQASDKEKQQYTYKGTSIESKLEPSLDGLGDCKLTQRDADEVYGLFAPDRYGIKEHAGYNIDIARDNYRSFSVLKSRDGEANLRMGMFFDGASNIISELPPATAMTKADYDKVLRLSGRL